MDSNPLFKRIIQQKLRKHENVSRYESANAFEKELPSSDRGLKEFNTEPIIDHNNMNLKTIQFQLNMLVSSGVQHELLSRFVNGSTTKIDIVGGTFKLFKVETRKLLSPLKIFIKYKKIQSSTPEKETITNLNASKQLVKKSETSSQDLKLLYSFSNPKPEESNCDGQAQRTFCLTIAALGDERVFPREYLFLKLSTNTGCQASLKVVFPKQDIIDAKVLKAQQAESGAGKHAGAKLSKKKISKDLEYMISKLINEQREYDTFMDQLKRINKKKIEK